MSTTSGRTVICPGCEQRHLTTPRACAAAATTEAAIRTSQLVPAAVEEPADALLGDA